MATDNPFDGRVSPTDRTVDYMVYALRCELTVDLPDIDKKYIASTQDPTDRTRFRGRIKKRHLVPVEETSKPTANKWLISDATGTTTYPLYWELADTAAGVYYVGQSRQPFRRIRQHLQGSSSTVFLEEMDIVGVRCVKPGGSPIDAPTLAEMLRMELTVDLQQSDRPADALREEYARAYDVLTDYDHVTVHTMKDARMRLRTEDWYQDRNGFDTLRMYDRWVDQRATQHEQQVGVDLTHVTGSFDGAFPLNRLVFYAYWN